MKRRGWRLLLLPLMVAAIALAADTDLREGRRPYLYQATDQWLLTNSVAVGMLEDPFPEYRVLAARVLASNPDPGRLLLLGKYAADNHPWARQAALVAAGRIGSEGLGLALDGLDDGSGLVRQAAVWAASHGGPEALDAVGQLVLLERDPAVRETALANMWRFGDALWEPFVVRYASHEDPLLRRAAAYSLARSESRRRAAGLITLARDDEPVIRATAIAGMASGVLTGAERGILIAALSDPDWRVQAAACTALAARPELELPETAAGRVSRLWRDSRAQLAVAAIEVAGTHSAVDDDEALAALVGQVDPWPSAVALAALARRGAPSAGRLATGWLEDGEPWQRRAAAAAAVHLSGQQAQDLAKRVFADPDPAVRLGWLEALDRETAATRADALRRVIDQDEDAAVRAQALELLEEAGEFRATDRLLALYRRWRSDALPDARAAALVAALEADEDHAARAAILETAASDPNSTVAALVVAAARRAGIDARLAAREERHPIEWYRELATWIDEQHWLDVVTVRGTFRIQLTVREAPITSREIFDLAATGFYDGLAFHRVVPNFVVQGGDPRGDGWGGPGFTLPDEPTIRPFDSWRVGIATSGPNTGGCQFFVTLMPADRLTGHYTNFGEVVAGREVLTQLQVGDEIVRIETYSGEPPPTPTPPRPTRPTSDQ